MPVDVKQHRLIEDDTTNGNKRAVDVRTEIALSAHIVASGGTSADVHFEVTNDPAGLVGWKDAAFREAGGGTYATTALTVVPATARSVFFDPSDSPVWIRAVVASQTGPTTLNCFLTASR
jgi:hypothetical protein